MTGLRDGIWMKKRKESRWQKIALDMPNECTYNERSAKRDLNSEGCRK